MHEFATGCPNDRACSSEDEMRRKYPADATLVEGEVELRVGTQEVSAAHPLPTRESDPLRSNIEATLLASAARTVETSSPDQVNVNGRGLILIVNITADPAAASITPTLEIRDPISGNYFTIWTAAAALAAVGTTAYLFEIGGVGSAGSFTEAINIRLTRTWRFTMTVANASSMTYSVSTNVLV